MTTADPVPRTIVENLQRGVRRFGDRPLLTVDGEAADRTVTYRQFADLVEGAAARLTAAGLRPGDRLAVCLPNGLDIAVAIWACARAGFVFVGLPTTLTARKWQTLLTHAAPTLTLAADEFLPQLNGVDSPVRPVDDVLTGHRLDWDADRPLPDPGETYALIYTSGTSGTPKGVRVAHRAAMHVAGGYRALLGLQPHDSTVIALPFSYVSGHLSQLNPFMLAGGSAVVLPRFEAGAMVRVLGEHEISVIDVVPAMFSLLLRHPGFHPDTLPALRTAFFGGAPMPPATISALRTRFPRLRLANVYGMTETAGLVTLLPDEELDARPGSSGRPVPGVDVRLVDESGRPVAQCGQPGNLQVRGPVVTDGYWQNPEATAAAFDGPWLRTGDRACLDADGCVTVLGRVDEMINRGGAKVSPADVEAALLEHPAVGEAVAFGIPAAVGGQDVAACVVLTGAAADDPDGTVRHLRAWLRGRLPVHARPRHLHVRAELPRGRTGKIDIASLREAVTAARTGQPPAAARARPIGTPGPAPPRRRC